MSHKVVLPIRANFTDTVDIKWFLSDGTSFHQRVTCPPKHTIEARKNVQEVQGETEEKTALP